MSNLKKRGVILGAIVVAAIAVYFLVSGSKSGSLLKREYGNVYTLVADKISQSAAVIIRLPAGLKINVAEASSKISFNPKVSGEWLPGKSDEYLVFQPSKKLEVGKYYSVALASEAIKLQKDFLVDDDPKIVSIFPNKDSEASEYSSVTIIFNRPMVPLTTLDILADKDVPIEIVPQTAGKFKWITTRNLQFIPEKRLQRSSRYIVSIKDGLISMDGLSVEPMVHKFSTRPLRYESTQNQGGQVIYSQPIRFVFNQPVDIERTVKGLIVKKRSGENVEFIAAYGTRSVYDVESRKYNKFLDKSILEIYNKSDRYGREKIWDFKTEYRYILERAYPVEGDIILEQSQGGNFSIGDAISSMSAESERSRLVAPTFLIRKENFLCNFLKT